MQTSMWRNAPSRATGAAMVAAMLALGGCGGGDSDTPALEVAVKVDGVADPSNPLSAGESTTISVPSGATLSFDSEGETRWSPTATGSSYEINSFSYTAKSMTVSSNDGGTLAIVFTNKGDETETATLNVTVAPKAFQRVVPREGELAVWKGTLHNGDGTTSDNSFRTRITLLNDGQYGFDTASETDPDTYSTRSLYDAQDGYLGWESLLSSFSCLYSASTANVSYPMHVGKTWSGASTRTCTDGSGFDVSYTRTVAAFQRINVPAGEFDTLRIESELSYQLPDSDRNYSVTSTCWWAVQIGRQVKCEYVYHFPEGTSGPARAVDELSSISN